MSVKDESMDCDQTEDDLEDQKLLNSSNYESLLHNNEQLLNNLNAKQVSLLKTLANNQQLNLMKKENFESNKLILKEEDLKKIENCCYSPNKELKDQDKITQASQKVILQHLQNKQFKQQLQQQHHNMNKELDQHSAPHSPCSVNSLQSIKSDHSNGSSTRLKLNNSNKAKFNQHNKSPVRLNGVLQDKQMNDTISKNETLGTIDNSPITSPISSPSLNNVNGLFQNIDSTSLNQHLNNQLVPALNNSNSRTSSPSNNELDKDLLNKLNAFQQLLNQQQQQNNQQQQQSSNLNNILNNLANLNRNGTTSPSSNQQQQQQQLNSMSTLNLLNNLINGSNLNNNNNQSTTATSNQQTNQSALNTSSSSTTLSSPNQSRNQLLNTLQKLNSLNNQHHHHHQNSNNSSFKDSNVNINNSNNSANSVSTVNSSSNGSKSFNDDSISNGQLNSPNSNIQVAWPTNGQTPSKYFYFF